MLSAARCRAVEAFLRDWHLGARPEVDVPVALVQEAAAAHPDPWVRRSCLGFLDHHAADVSGDVFLAALDDPVAPVRHTALHGLACERCRTEDLCVPDVADRVGRVLAGDPDPEARYKAIPILVRLAGREPRALAALAGAAGGDGDERVRAAAAAVLAGGHPPGWNRARRRSRSRRAKAARRAGTAP